MNKFGEFQFSKMATRHLWNSELESTIIEYCNEMDLMLPDNFRRCHWRFYHRVSPLGFIEYSILFQARPKTVGDNLREQIEFQIQQLEK